MSCAFPGCKEPAHKTCSRCLETKYCSAAHQKSHWKWHKKICVALEKNMSTPVSSVPVVFMKGKEEDEEEEDLCIVCLDNVANAKLRPCGHSATCKGCTEELTNLSTLQKADLGTGYWQVAELDCRARAVAS
ncbi:hypothetical protein TrLO_g13755 [Triparma laevis f. longispina]|uniref:MYND-type domain-containing protein n=1 Tax=Triparma laevis f. longispina TaxID=1714387 RepID=A0A9W7FNV6_9STRA|nr:hypothetical protein TrLO_g13755 [Triparma laevis f. longispina]